MGKKTMKNLIVASLLLSTAALAGMNRRLTAFAAELCTPTTSPVLLNDVALTDATTTVTGCELTVNNIDKTIYFSTSTSSAARSLSISDVSLVGGSMYIAVWGQSYAEPFTLIISNTKIERDSPQDNIDILTISGGFPKGSSIVVRDSTFHGFGRNAYGILFHTMYVPQSSIVIEDNHFHINGSNWMSGAHFKNSFHSNNSFFSISGNWIDLFSADGGDVEFDAISQEGTHRSDDFVITDNTITAHGLSIGWGVYITGGLLPADYVYQPTINEFEAAAVERSKRREKTTLRRKQQRLQRRGNKARRAAFAGAADLNTTARMYTFEKAREELGETRYLIAGNTMHNAKFGVIIMDRHASFTNVSNNVMISNITYTSNNFYLDTIRRFTFVNNTLASTVDESTVLLASNEIAAGAVVNVDTNTIVSGTRDVPFTLKSPDKGVNMLVSPLADEITFRENDVIFWDASAMEKVQSGFVSGTDYFLRVTGEHDPSSNFSAKAFVVSFNTIFGESLNTDALVTSAVNFPLTVFPLSPAVSWSFLIPTTTTTTTTTTTPTTTTAPSTTTTTATTTASTTTSTSLTTPTTTTTAAKPSNLFFDMFASNGQRASSTGGGIGGAATATAVVGATLASVLLQLF